MSASITDLYRDYMENVAEALEENEYFQYLFEMLEAGDNSFFQCSRLLHKVIDQQWIIAIEESLDALEAIAQKPRRFLASREEVVPVGLAKKITADSVRHLSQNTQFIASAEDGNVMPTRILTVTAEESFDLYENRFIYHLIQRLATFIDKRTDVIFWTEGDESVDVMKMESAIEDDNERITYKVEMTVKNKKAGGKSQGDYMGIYQRIDRARRRVRTLKAGQFCQIMKGCSLVRSPIQRTNLMMKDPQYRTCYQLWHFLERYDSIGYTIEEQDSMMEFDEEYLLQMYTNMITNYTVFKSLLISDPRGSVVKNQFQQPPVCPRFLTELVPDPENRDIVDENGIRMTPQELLQVMTELRSAYDDAAYIAADLTEQLEQTEDTLTEKSALLTSCTAQLTQTETALQTTREQLQSTRQTLTERQSALEQSETRLSQERENNRTLQGSLQESKQVFEKAKTRLEQEKVQNRLTQEAFARLKETETQLRQANERFRQENEQLREQAAKAEQAKEAAQRELRQALRRQEKLERRLQAVSRGGIAGWLRKG